MCYRSNCYFSILFSQCRPVCGSGVQTRNVYCVSAEGNYMQAIHCNSTTPPPKQRKCNNGACPPPSWEPGAWGEVRHPSQKPYTCTYCNVVYIFDVIFIIVNASLENECHIITLS